MNVVQTSTLVQPSFTPYHGVTPFTYSEVMDVDTDGQHHPDRNSDKGTMDANSGSAQDATVKGKGPKKQEVQQPPIATNETTAADQPAQVLERPREGEGNGVQELPKQTCKAPH